MKAIRTVLCPVDLSPLARETVRLGIELCKRTGARLILQHNLDSRPPDYLSVRWMWSEDQEREAPDTNREASTYLRELLKEIPAEVVCEAKLTHGPIDVSVLNAAELLQVDAIVLATHGPSGSEHSSLTERLILKAPCPVLAIGESYARSAVRQLHNEAQEITVLVPYDFSSHSRACLNFALALAEQMPHRIRLLHALPDSEADAHVARASAAVLEKQTSALVPETLRQRVQVAVVAGSPVETIIDEAAHAGAAFILMGAHGKGFFKRFLFGTVTVGVLHRSLCPVLFIPPAVRRRREWRAA